MQLLLASSARTLRSHLVVKVTPVVDVLKGRIIMNRRQFLCASAASFTCVGNVSAAAYDLVITGGRVIDPSVGLDAVRDVAIITGKIIHTEPLLALLRIPQIVWSAMPFVVQIVFTLFFVVAQFGTSHVEGGGVVGDFGGVGDEDELGLGVEGAADEPGAGGAVDVNAGAGGPFHAVCPCSWWVGWRALTARSAARRSGGGK